MKRKLKTFDGPYVKREIFAAFRRNASDPWHTSPAFKSDVPGKERLRIWLRDRVNPSDVIPEHGGVAGVIYRVKSGFTASERFLGVELAVDLKLSETLGLSQYFPERLPLSSLYPGTGRDVQLQLDFPAGEWARVE